MNETLIITKIFEGIKYAFDYTEKTRGQIEALIKPEYLLTVKIAESISSLNDLTNPAYIIRLEEPTSEFSYGCLPNYSSEKFILTELKDSIIRKGKIDIAVYLAGKNPQFHYPKALFPIEVKSFKNTKYAFLADVERNIEYFKINDEITGDSHIELAYCTALEDSRIYYKEDKASEINRISEKYENWLCNLKKEETNIDFEVKVKTICDHLYSKDDTFDLTEGQTEIDYLSDSYHYIAVIVIIKRRKQNN